MTIRFYSNKHKVVINNVIWDDSVYYNTIINFDTRTIIVRKYTFECENVGQKIWEQIMKIDDKNDRKKINEYMNEATREFSIEDEG